MGILPLEVVQLPQLCPLPRQTLQRARSFLLLCVLTFRTTKTVRFLLVPPHNDNTPISSQSLGQILMLKDPAPDVPKLKTAACRWKKCHFDMLNVEYNPNAAYTFDFELVELLPKLSQRILFSLS